VNALNASNPGLWTEGAARLRDLEGRLMNLWSLRGYGEVAPPLLMAEGMARAASPQALANRSLRVSSNGDGTLALRADFTASVAWMTAQRVTGLESPLRVSYAGPVLRVPSADRPEGYETMQAGCERISPLSGPEGDGEVVCLAAESLLTLDLEGAVFELGHWGLVGPLIERIPWPREGRQALETALNRKSAPVLDDLGERYGRPPEWLLLKELLHLGGRPAEVDALLPRLKAAGVDGSWIELRDLEGVLVRRFPGLAIRLEPTDVRHWSYYTGLTVKAFAPSHPYAILSGGRYDGLFPSMGRPFGACGFAVHLGRLLD
jgi:ATP phosphoribosyltransferase regulatory subunit